MCLCMQHIYYDYFYYCLFCISNLCCFYVIRNDDKLMYGRCGAWDGVTRTGFSFPGIENGVSESVFSEFLIKKNDEYLWWTPWIEPFIPIKNWTDHIYE